MSPTCIKLVRYVTTIIAITKIQRLYPQFLRFYKLKGLILNLNETQLELKKLLQQNSFLIPPILYFFDFFGIEQRRDEEKRQAILKMLTHTDVGTTTTCI